MFVGPAYPSLLSLKHTKMSIKRRPRNGALVFYSQAKHNPQFLYSFVGPASPSLLSLKYTKYLLSEGPNVALVLCSQARLNPRFIYLDEGLRMETSVLETLNGGQFTSVISSVDKTKLSFIN